MKKRIQIKRWFYLPTLLIICFSIAQCSSFEEGSRNKKDKASPQSTQTEYSRNQEQDRLQSEGNNPVSAYDRFVHGIGQDTTDLLYNSIGESEMDLLAYGVGASNVIQLVNLTSDINKLIAMVGDSFANPVTGLGAARIIALLNTINAELQTNTYSGSPPANQDTIGKMGTLINSLTLSDINTKVIELINAMGVTRTMGNAGDQGKITSLSILIAHVADVNKVVTILSNMPAAQVISKLKDIILGVSDMEKMVAVVDKTADVTKLSSLLIDVTDAARLVTILNAINTSSSTKLAYLVDNVTITNSLATLVNNIGNVTKMSSLINKMEDGTTWTGQNGGSQNWSNVPSGANSGMVRLKNIVNTLIANATTRAANLQKLVNILDGVSDITKMMRIIQDLADISDITTIISALTDPAVSAGPSQNLGTILENVSLVNMPRMVTMVNGKRSVSSAAQTAYLGKLDTILEGITAASQGPVKVAAMVEGISNVSKVVDLVYDVTTTSNLVTVINGINPANSASPNHTAVRTLVYVVEYVSSASKLVTVINGASASKVTQLVNEVASGSQKADDNSADLDAAGKKLNTVIGGVIDTNNLVTVLNGVTNVTKMATLLNALKVTSASKVVTLVNDISSMSRLIDLVNNVTNMTEMAVIVDGVADMSKLVTLVNNVSSSGIMVSLVNAVIADAYASAADIVGLMNGVSTGDMSKLVRLINDLNGAKDTLIAGLMASFDGTPNRGVGYSDMVTLISGLTNDTSAARLASLLLTLNPSLSYAGGTISSKIGMVRLLKAGVTYNSVQFPGIGGVHIATVMNLVSSASTLSTLMNGLAIEDMGPLLGCADQVAGFRYPCSAIGQPFPSRLVAHYPFSGNANDGSPNGNNGTVSGATLTTDRFGNANSAYSFNGSSSINLGNPSGFQRLTGDQTIAMWLTPADFSARRNPYAKAYGGTGTITQETNGTLSYYWGTCGGNCSPYQGFNTGTSITLNKPNHIAIVRDLTGSNKLKWYINGTKITEVAASYQKAVAGTNPAYIGTGYTSAYSGVIDDVRIYSRALTESEIQKLYGPSAIYNFAGNANDSSIFGNTGSVSGATLTPDRFGLANKAYNFNGNSAITVADNPALRISHYTVSIWIYPNGVPNETWKGIIGKAGRNYNFWLHNYGYVHHRFHTSSSTNSGAPDTANGSIAWNAWNHVILTNDGITAKTYINGVEKASGSASGDQIIDNNLLNIGRNVDGGASAYFNGKLDDIRIYPRAVDTTEVTDLYSLVGHYTFDGNTMDISGNDNHGTAAGGPTLTTDRFGNTNSAYYFDGVNDYVQIPTAGMSNQTGTITYWVKPNFSGGDSSYNGTFQTRTPGNWGNQAGQIIVLDQWAGTTFYFRIVPDSGCCSTDLTFGTSGVFSLNQWKHVAVTWDKSASTIKIYLNSLLKTSRTDWTQTTNTALEANGYIGIGHDKYYKGSIDDYRIYNRALTDDEIRAVYGAEQ